jgi:predicted DNA-binding transcriptional regulator AlpA
MTTPPLLPPRPLDPADEPARQAAAAGAWVCRSCAHILKVRFTYAPSPWAYCLRCSGTLMPDEQLVAGARLQAPERAINRRGSTPVPVDYKSSGDILTIPEAAAMLRRSVKGTYRLAAAGDLPGASKVGGRWVVSQSCLLRSLTEGRVLPRRSRR